MQLLHVELHDFRNAPAVGLEPHPRFNVLSGDNGQGKTNFLEAIYLAATLRSFRASRLEELVRFGAEVARSSVRALHRGLDRRYDVEIRPPQGGRGAARKVAKVDGKSVRAAAEYFGGFNVVLFSPDDLRLPRGAPAARRRFVDRAVWNVEPAFLKEAQTFERVLKSRNAVLKAGREGRGNGTAMGLLDVYDEQLAQAGAHLAARRRRYLLAIAPRVAAAFERISRSGLGAALRYESALTAFPGAGEAGRAGIGVGGLVEELVGLLRKARGRDLSAGFTTVGPHTDDLALDLDGRPARLFASQGQLRALVLSLKVAEIQHLSEVVGDPPVLLLDDVSSELDPRRNAFLFEFLREGAGQVFITTTDPGHVLVDADRRDFRVVAGRIE